jgi:hypothetical protein
MRPLPTLLGALACLAPLAAGGGAGNANPHRPG